MKSKYNVNEHVIFIHQNKTYHGTIKRIEEEVDGHKYEVFDYCYYIDSDCTDSWMRQNKIIGLFTNEDDFKIIQKNKRIKFLNNTKKTLMDEKAEIENKINEINKELEIVDENKSLNIRFNVYDIENQCYLNRRDCFVNGLGQFLYRDSQGILNCWNKDFKLELEK